jgi:predicted SAM-dependent methyltransferase
MERRLNWGCGPRPARGWLNSDVRAFPGVQYPCNILEGLPIESGSIDYAVAIHVLQDMAWGDIPPALRELHRVLKPGGVLRLALPDLDRAISAYLGRDREYFYVPDSDAVSIGAKLITQIIWYGSVKTPFVFEYIEELLLAAGYERIVRCAYTQTASRYPEIVELDNRPRESMFVEANKPAAGSQA